MNNKYDINPHVTKNNIQRDLKLRVESLKLAQAVKNGDQKTLDKILPNKNMQSILKQVADFFKERFPDDMDI